MSEFTNKNIWVFIETDEGKTKSVGLELLPLYLARTMRKQLSR